MKKTVLVLLMTVLLLCSCAKTEEARLVLSDEVETLPAGCRKYQISVCLPAGMTEAVSAQSSDQRLYESEDGSYYVVTEIIKDCDAQQAIRRLTGFDADALGTIRTEAMSMPEYRFSWCTEGETGSQTCTGIVLEDTAYCYCLAFCADEAAAKACADVRNQVMSGFGLYYDEGF